MFVIGRGFRIKSRSVGSTEQILRVDWKEVERTQSRGGRESTRWPRIEEWQATPWRDARNGVSSHGPRMKKPDQTKVSGRVI